MERLTTIVQTLAVAALCASLNWSCDRSPQSERQAAPDGRPSVGHPAVPGRTMPCPREGGLDKADHPCEPPTVAGPK